MKQLSLFDVDETAASAEGAAAVFPRLNSISSNEDSKVNGYFARLSFALRLNIKAFIDRHGVEKVGFFTLTAPDEFAQQDAKEFQRRYNSFATGFLRKRFKHSIMVCERGGKSGHFHAHLLVAFDYDIRTGYDFAAVKRRDYRSVRPRLLRFWALLRYTCRRYRLGRPELQPLKTNSEAVSRYVSDYVCKHFRHRFVADRGCKLVRYSGCARIATTRFGFDSVRSRLFRRKVGAVAQVVGIDRAHAERPEEYLLNGVRVRTPGKGITQFFGDRWAYHLGKTISRLQLPEYQDKLSAQIDGHDVAMVPDDAVKISGLKGRRCVTQYQNEQELRAFFKGDNGMSVFRDLANIFDWSKVNEPMDTDGMKKACNHWRIIHAIDRDNAEYWKSEEDGVPIINGVPCPF